jgi:hypothetical protein
MAITMEKRAAKLIARIEENLYWNSRLLSPCCVEKANKSIAELKSMKPEEVVRLRANIAQFYYRNSMRKGDVKAVCLREYPKKRKISQDVFAAMLTLY